MTMKTLGLMRNLLSGREVLLLFYIPWGSWGYGSGGGEFPFLFLPFSLPHIPWELGRRLFFEDGPNLLCPTLRCILFAKSPKSCKGEIQMVLYTESREKNSWDLRRRFATILGLRITI